MPSPFVDDLSLPPPIIDAVGPGGGLDRPPMGGPDRRPPGPRDLDRPMFDPRGGPPPGDLRERELREIREMREREMREREMRGGPPPPFERDMGPPRGYPDHPYDRDMRGGPPLFERGPPFERPPFDRMVRTIANGFELLRRLVYTWVLRK